MAFQIGDKVRLLNEDEEGVILKFHNQNKVDLEIDDFIYTYSISEIIKVTPSQNIIHVPVENPLKNSEEVQPVNNKEVLQHIPKKVFHNISRLGYPEIDLHIYELVDKPKNLSNSEMLQIQTFRLEQFIQDCIANLVSEFVVIHGVGEGVLRLEVQKILESHGNIEFKEADFREYGTGATYAKILGLFQ
ncbi:MAG: Smr/MutS family protein [Salibacteraceae bacterium]